MSKVKKSLKLGKDITEEDLAFNPEQQEKIAKLRKEKEDTSSIVSELDNTHHDKLPEGSPCRFTSDGHTFIGYIIEVYKEDNTHYYDIDTPGGVMKKIPYNNVYYRQVYAYEGDKSCINVDLYKMTTQKLLNELKKCRTISMIGTSDYQKAIKAVLETRPHIPTKAERKAIIKNHLSIQKERKLKRKKKK
jgi:hypothetical protein